MPRLLVERGPDRGKSVSVAAGQQIVVGRDPTANLQLADNMCSRRHFLIGSKNGMFGIKDLGSANGTLVNGRRTEGAQKLQFGDSIQIGETLLSWLSDEQTEKRGGIVGNVIGGYRIEQRIGRGAMGTVYRATQLSLGRTVALKVLAAELVKDARFRDMFLKEARAAGGLNHPNIIQVYDVGDDAGAYFFSMEFAAKGSVQDELQATKRIEIPRAVRIMRDACGALDYAERKGLVHRDIKPDNLMVMEDDSVKLGDLGLAMSAQELQGEQEGVFGTPHYIAPEQAMGKPIDHRADIYALGATFYRMLSGRTMYTGATVKDILRQQVREPHTPVTQLVPDCPEGLRRVLDRMLAKNPAERYQHASEIASDLADFENLSTRKAFGAASPFSAKPQVVRSGRPDLAAEVAKPRRLLASMALLAIVLGAAVYGIWHFGFKEPGQPPAPPVQPPAATQDRPAPPPELTPEQRAANQNLQNEITLANYVLSRPTASISALADDIERAQRVRERNPAASPEIQAQLDALIERLEQRHTAMTQGRDQAREEYELAWRDTMRHVEAFQFETAREPLAEFIAKWSANEDEEVKRILEAAHTTLAQTLPERSQQRLDEFQRGIERQAREAASKPAAERARRLEELATEVRKAEQACDDPISRSRLAALAESLQRDATALQDEAERTALLALEQAALRARANLESLLEQVRQDVAAGRFQQAQERVRIWIDTDTDFSTHKGSEKFEAIRADLELRQAQTRLIAKALAALADAMPPLHVQRLRLLPNARWTGGLERFFGGSEVPIRLVWADETWRLEVHDAAPNRSLSAGDFSANADRVLLGRSLWHLFEQHEPMRDALLRATHETPPAIIGVAAWLMELEAYSPAAAFIEHAWQQVAQTSPHRQLLREYYAWNLLGLASLHAESGETEQAQALLRRLESEFADTRANRGRP